VDLSEIVEKLGLLGRDHGQEQDQGASAAVAAIFREHAGAAEIFFIRRAQRAGDPWSGHVAFPGGRREPEDRSLLETAMRETREEVGIVLEERELIARLPDLPAFNRSKTGGAMVVSPFVFVVKHPVVIAPQESEVASTMWVPFEKLVRGEGRGTFIWSYEGKTLELPCFHLGGCPGPSPIEAAAIAAGQPILWGMTYRMLETLFEAILPVSEQI
jgi:8-oxo-dGTP pyrophosphatase MutT (NUDIX family)